MDISQHSLIRVTTLQLEGATWGDLRALVNEADTADISNETGLEIEFLSQDDSQIFGIKLTVPGNDT